MDELGDVWSRVDFVSDDSPLQGNVQAPRRGLYELDQSSHFPGHNVLINVN